MNIFKHKTTLYNGEVVKEGDKVSVIDSDGNENIGVVSKRKYNCTEQDTGKLLKKGTLFFCNNCFDIKSYTNARKVK